MLSMGVNFGPFEGGKGKQGLFIGESFNLEYMAIRVMGYLNSFNLLRLRLGVYMPFISRD